MGDRFLYITDCHYGCKPITRKDDYNKSILNKIEFVFKLARKYNCTILNGGDLFDTPKIKFIDFIPIAKLFSIYKDVSFYSLRGNPSHDGNDEISALRFFQSVGLIKNSKGFEDFDNTRIIFKDNGQIDISPLSKDKYNILMTHQIISKEPTIFEHTLIDEFYTDCDMVTIADYHTYQGIITRNDGKVFVAPGAIARRKKTKENIEHNPKCVFIVIGDDNKLKKMQEIDIPFEKDVWVNKEVVDIYDEISYNQLDLEIEKMKELIDTSSFFMKLEDLITFYAKTMSVDINILNYVLKRI